MFVLVWLCGHRNLFVYHTWLPCRTQQIYRGFGGLSHLNLLTTWCVNISCNCTIICHKYETCTNSLCVTRSNIRNQIHQFSFHTGSNLYRFKRYQRNCSPNAVIFITGLFNIIVNNLVHTNLFVLIKFAIGQIQFTWSKHYRENIPLSDCENDLLQGWSGCAGYIHVHKVLLPDTERTRLFSIKPTNGQVGTIWPISILPLQSQCMK